MEKWYCITKIEELKQLKNGTDILVIADGEEIHWEKRYDGIKMHWTELDWDTFEDCYDISQRPLLLISDSQLD